MRRSNGGAAAGDLGGSWPWPIGVAQEAIRDSWVLRKVQTNLKRLVRLSRTPFSGFLPFFPSPTVC